jgi:hypothetical protein
MMQRDEILEQLQRTRKLQKRQKLNTTKICPCVNSGFEEGTKKHTSCVKKPENDQKKKRSKR